MNERTRTGRAARPKGRTALVGLAVWAMVLIGLAPVAAQTDDGAKADEAGRALMERPVPPKPDAAVIPEGYSDRYVHVKLSEGQQIESGGGFWVSAEADIAGLNAVLDSTGSEVSAMFGGAPADLRAEKARIEAKSGREQADKSLWFIVEVPDESDATTVIDGLNALSGVEIAYPEPLPQPPPVTPNFEPQQLYRDPAPTGADANYAATVPGGTGANVKIIDIEYSWNENHEDLAAAVGGLVPNGTPCDFFNDNNHGTAVLGELIGTSNGFGVTGMVPDAAVGMTNAGRLEGGICRYRLAEAINVAHGNLVDGDLILLEQQTAGPDPTCTNMGGSQNGLVAVEWVQSYYDAIVAAVSDGIIVVEAAGNGSCNFDNAIYGNPFPAGRPDSGAIIVGAGYAPGSGPGGRARLGFSGHGTRVDVQGYGNNVVTTGYGGLQGGPVNEWYTSTFGGTSGASPIVTGAAAVLSSVAQQNGGLITSQQARATLKATGTPQNFGPGALTGNIGPLVDIQAALGGTCASNDDFACASTLAGPPGTATGSNVGFTTETGEPDPSCGDSLPGSSNTAWWDWTAPSSAPVVFDTAGSNFDTVLTVYTGPSVGSLSEEQCDDDDGPGLTSSLVLNPVAGGTYRVQVDGFGGATGNITLNVSAYAGPLCSGLGVTVQHPAPATVNDDVIRGTAGNDTILANDGHDVICGLGGDDDLRGGSGLDTIYGDEGNDILRGGSDGDLLEGGIGDDQLFGDFGPDFLDGGTGNDILRGSLGPDFLVGGSGNDDLHGGSEIDDLDGGDGVDIVRGGGGNDVVRGGAGDDTVQGGTDDDEVHGDAGNDMLTGNAHNDTLFGGIGNDTMFGGPGTDTLHGEAGTDTMRGNDGADELRGGLDADTLFGDHGNDVLYGDGGDDVLNGGLNADQLFGNAGVDDLNGNGGGDALHGGSQAPDDCNGGSGPDTHLGGCEIITNIP